MAPPAVRLLSARPGRLDWVALRARAEMPPGFANNEIHNPAAISPTRSIRPDLDRVRLSILRSGWRARNGPARRRDHLSCGVFS
jgi:hypothetical protein